jgi:hypothetical protein
VLLEGKKQGYPLTRFVAGTEWALVNGSPAFRMICRLWALLAQLKTCSCSTMKTGVSLA